MGCNGNPDHGHCESCGCRLEWTYDADVCRECLQNEHRARVTGDRRWLLVRLGAHFSCERAA